MRKTQPKHKKGDGKRKMVTQKLDTTIECVCDFLKREIERVSSIYESQELTELTKALAELVSARAKLN